MARQEFVIYVLFWEVAESRGFMAECFSGLQKMLRPRLLINIHIRAQNACCHFSESSFQSLYSKALEAQI